MKNKSNSTYKQILKATSIIGGVQVVSIIISIVRSKFIAVLLGPVGIGISGMFTSAIGVISNITNFGLGTSAIRDISAAFETNNTKRIAIVTKVLNSWIFITGLLGMFLALIFSPVLSYISFGNYNYTISFILLSFTLVLNQINSGHLVLLQGSRKISFLAKANLVGSIIGMITTLPIYYFWGLEGIIPSLIISSILSILTSTYFKNKIYIEEIKVSKARIIAEGKQMLKMGFFISLSGFITVGFSYLVRLFISHNGSMSDVGLYSAGFAIVTTYVGLIFTAMGTDYYPRLSGLVSNLKKANNTINNQIEIALILIGPILVFFILFNQTVINILYSQQFLVISKMLIWATLGMLFKTVSWCIAFYILAKGTSRIFFLNELITNIYLTALNIIGYYFWGLTGLGYSYLLSYIIYMLQIFMITNKQFGFILGRNSIIILLVQLLFSILAVILFFNQSLLNYYVYSALIFFINLSYSYWLLNKRVDILGLFRNK